MKKIVNTILLVLILVHCDSGNNFNSELSKENLIELELKQLNISIQVPRGHSISEFDDFTVIYSNLRGRQFSISKVKSNIQKNRYKKSFRFDKGATLKYSTFVKKGGNGGPEYELEGIFEFKNGQLLITSTDQREYGKGTPEFCMKYLSTIKKLKH